MPCDPPFPQALRQPATRKGTRSTLARIIRAWPSGRKPRAIEGAGRFLPFVAAGTLVVSFGVAIFARFFRAPRIDQTTDQQTDESDPYLAGMVMVALRAEERRDAERFRAEMAEFGIGFPLHHVERF